MKILISNDDGVYAPGINVLNKKLSDNFDTYVVAPLEERSTTGHTLSLDNPLRVVEVNKEKNIYGCSGFPADCTIMGFGKLMPERPQVVVSGINRGANLAQDVYYSGTMAAAREGVFHGIPGIAISLDCGFQHHEEEELHFGTAANFLNTVLSKKSFLSLFQPNQVLNINVPNLPESQIKGIQLTQLGFRRYSEDITCRQDFRGRDYYWIGGIYEGFVGEEKTDCFAVEKGFISVTVLNLLGHASDEIVQWQKFIDNL